MFATDFRRMRHAASRLPLWIAQEAGFLFYDTIDPLFGRVGNLLALFALLRGVPLVCVRSQVGGPIV